MPETPGILSEDRRKLLLDLKESEVKSIAEKDRLAFAATYKAAITHQQALIRIDNEYLEARKALGDKATKEQLDNLEQERLMKIQKENESNLGIKAGWVNLFANFDKLSRASIIKRLQDVKKLYQEAKGKPVDQGGISEGEADEKIGQIDSAITALDGNASFKSVGDKLKKFFKTLHDGGLGTEAAQGALR